MKILRLLIAALLLFAPGLPAAEEVPPGSALRKTLFQSIRPQAEKLAGGEVKFFGSLRRQDNWAFFLGTLVDSQGRAVLLGEVESSDAMALWKKEGGEWRIITFAAGFTDVFYLDYPQKYGVPAQLLFPDSRP